MLDNPDLLNHLQLFMRSGDDFGERVQDENGNMIFAEEEYEDKVPDVIVCRHIFDYFFCVAPENSQCA